MSTGRVRNMLELALPGSATGLAAGLAVGGLAALVGQPAGWALAGALALGVPLALLGGGYGILVAVGPFKPGVFAPAALYWMVGFPLTRLLHETVAPMLVGGPASPPADLLPFLAYQGLVSLGYAVGFIWMYERIAPYWLMRVRDHNPPAQRLFQVYADHAAAVWETRERRRAQRSAGRAPVTAATRRS